MFWGTRATNFSIYTTKMEGAGPKILGTGAKFKQVPCQKNCRVNQALNPSPHVRVAQVCSLAKKKNPATGIGPTINLSSHLNDISGTSHLPTAPLSILEIYKTNRLPD